MKLFFDTIYKMDCENKIDYSKAILEGINFEGSNLIKNKNETRNNISEDIFDKIKITSNITKIIK